MEIIKDLSNKAFFTLFHHDIYSTNTIFYYDGEQLRNYLESPKNIGIKSFSDIIYINIVNELVDNNNSNVSLTLTGGMDSRIILACLLKAGVKPNCIVYGNPESRDVIYARELAKSFGLPFHNAASNKPDKDWYYKWVVETIKRDEGNAHLHRAHRTAAIAEHAEKYKPQVLFTGHMGGEGLRGLSYNNYFSSPFFELVNEGKMGMREAAEKVLYDYFLRQDKINYDEIIKDVSKRSWMKYDRLTNKFFFLYDLVANIHHAQDMRLFKSYVPNVVPVYLQKEYLETLFSSPYNFMAKKKGILGRLQNPLVYCKIIEQIYPDLLDYPLANGFSPREYLRGLWSYVPLKLYRDLKNKKKYPPSFSYGEWYVDFVKEHSQNISPEIWEIYDKKKYMHALENNDHRTDEGYWHKFSNPIYFDLVEKYKKGIL